MQYLMRIVSIQYLDQRILYQNSDESQRDDHSDDVPSEISEPRKGCKWIFKKKMKVDGTIDTFKARLVIQGFRQKERIDYFDTYAPVARITTIRLLLALAAIHNLQPEGFVMLGNEHRVCKLVKSLYGLKQTPKQWHQKFDEKKLKPNTGKHVDQLEYSRAIGFLMYAMTSTRPDIAYVVGRLNSSSTSGWVFLLGGGVISWASKKQTCIIGSTVETEFVALADAGKKEWLRNLIHEIPIWPKPIASISIRCDSAPTMARAYSQIYNRKYRHLADHLTKGLARDLEYKREANDLTDIMIEELIAKMMSIAVKNSNNVIAAKSIWNVRKYNQLLPIIAEKFNKEKERNEKLKEVKARFNFKERSRISGYFESRTMNTREHERRHKSRRSRSRKDKTMVHANLVSHVQLYKKCIKDPLEIHNIKQRDGESTKDFVKRYKLESRDVKGAPECMRISRFVHGIINPKLIKRLHDKIPKTVDEMMRVTTPSLGWKWRPQITSGRSHFHHGNSKRVTRSKISTKEAFETSRDRKRGRIGLRSSKKLPKNFFSLDKGKSKAPPPMTTPVKKQNHVKFCEFHGEVGHTTDECMHLKKQIEEMLKAGKLSHLIKELKQNNGKEQPKERVAMQRITQSVSPNPEILFPPLGENEGTKGPIIIGVEIGGHCLHQMYVDGGSASEVLYDHCFNRLHPEIKNQLVPANTPLIGFSVKGGVITLKSSKMVPLECAMVSEPEGNLSVTKKTIEERVKVAINPEYLEQTIMIVSTLTQEGHNKLCDLLQHRVVIGSCVITFTLEMQVTLHDKIIVMQVTLHYEAIVMQVTLHDKRIVMQVTSHYEAIVMQVTLHDKRIVMQVTLHLNLNKNFPQKKCNDGPADTTGVLKAGSSREATEVEHRIRRIQEDSPDTLMEVEEELTEPWILFTDGSSCTDGFRARLILTNPEGMEFTYALRFRFDTTNKKAEYDALIAGLRIVEQIGVKNLQANIDSRLVANQVNGTYVEKVADMIRYLEKVKALTSGFKALSIRQVPRNENKKADALCKIASTSFAHLSKQVLVEELKEKSISKVEILAVVEEGDTWMTSIFKYLTEGYPSSGCKKSKSSPLQADYMLREIHEGSCSMHAGTRSVVAKALRLRKVKFLIVAIGYFTKWIEAKPVATITGNQIKKFMWNNIVCMFRLPREINSDNEK
uniref:Reverse transcriptase domain-containing protein n=1 Tax=Tanacetum cinerariifolium TaxID=118510 RepID=A0A6L2P0C5_TANCI|nr:reverse transcriptase domain-containing protein [Tanacetum cinerariifolium]